MRQALTQEHGEKIHKLIMDCRDIFSTKDEPPGQTDVVKHKVKTSGPPTKSYYTQVLAGLMEEAIQKEQRMKRLGVIKRSEPLSQKTDGTLCYCIDNSKLNQGTQRTVISCPTPMAA